MSKDCDCNDLKVLTKDDIFVIDDIQVEKMEVPEWGGIIGVKVMTCKERQEFQVKMGGARDKIPTNLMEELILLTVVNPCTKQRLFTDKNDVKELAKKSSQIMGRIFEKAAGLNGLTSEAIEDSKKN